MRAHPALAQAMATGDVSYAKARVLAAHLTATNARALVDLACTNTADRLGAAIAAWANRNEDPDEIGRRQHENRSVSWRTEPDGTITITAKLPPAAAGAVIAVIDQHVTTNTAPAGASLPQQRADALTHLATNGGITPHAAGGPTTIANLQRLCGPHNRAKSA